MKSQGEEIPTIVCGAMQKTCRQMCNTHIQRKQMEAQVYFA